MSRKRYLSYKYKRKFLLIDISKVTNDFTFCKWFELFNSISLIDYSSVRPFYSREALYVPPARIRPLLGKPALNGFFVTTDDALCRRNYLYYAETARAARLKL